MLDPDRRHLLLDGLRPPDGYELVSAVGTTFSLDLDALLLAPVAFALFDARASATGDPGRMDPLAVMEAVRRNADRIDIFCQAGQIVLPPRDRPILALLEQSVHPVIAPQPGRIFHPKVWALEFQQGQSVMYRLLVLSRNLTFDRSWDTVVVLDGHRTDRSRPMNAPLAALLNALPGLAVRTLPEDRRSRVRTMGQNLMTVAWDSPEGVDDIKFHVSGLSGSFHAPPRDVDRLLLISPFVSAEQLQDLSDGARRATLVSRPEALDVLPEPTLSQFEEVLVLIDAASEQEALAEQDWEETATAMGTEPSGSGTPEKSSSDLVLGLGEDVGERATTTLVGLHAKVLVVERGAKAEMRCGSTNATRAGWRGNVEFDVGLVGHRRRVGIDAVLGTGGSETGLHMLLTAYRRRAEEPLDISDEENDMAALEAAGRAIAAIPLTGHVVDDGEFFRLTVSSETPLPRSEVTIRAWLPTRSPESGAVQHPGEPVSLVERGLSLQALTSFVAFELSSGTSRVRVLANAALVGEPEDRSQRLLLEQLQSKADVLRYLLFLLADLGDGSFQEAARALLRDAWGVAGGQSLRIPLLESMVRALSRNPKSLRPVASLIADLQGTEQGRYLLPDGIGAVWPAIQTALGEANP